MGFVGAKWHYPDFVSGVKHQIDIMKLKHKLSTAQVMKFFSRQIEIGCGSARPNRKLLVMTSN